MCTQMNCFYMDPISAARVLDWIASGLHTTPFLGWCYTCLDGEVDYFCIDVSSTGRELERLTSCVRNASPVCKLVLCLVGCRDGLLLDEILLLSVYCTCVMIRMLGQIAFRWILLRLVSGGLVRWPGKTVDIRHIKFEIHFFHRYISVIRASKCTYVNVLIQSYKPQLY